MIVIESTFMLAFPFPFPPHFYCFTHTHTPKKSIYNLSSFPRSASCSIDLTTLDDALVFAVLVHSVTIMDHGELPDLISGLFPFFWDESLIPYK